jgi:single-strand DNA-binding protein
MAGETLITVIGNLTNDPEVRFTPGSGDAVANFSIASTPRTFDRTANEWKDGETLFLRASAWRELANNIADTLHKGMRVIASGHLKSRSYEKDGEKRTVIEFEVQEIGPSLKYATAQVTRVQGGQQGGAPQGQGGFGGGQQGQPQGGGFGGQQGGPQGGGWGGPPQGQPQGQPGGWGGQPQGGQQGPGWGAQQGGGQPVAQGEDPWATPGVSNPGGGQWGNGPAQGQQGGTPGF